MINRDFFDESIDIDIDDDELLLWGTSTEDILIGTSNSEIIFGRKGNDNLIGKDGNDSLFGGTGNDIIASGRGNNLLLGNQGNDFLEVSTTRSGAAGKNTLSGGAGDDILVAGDNDDWLLGGTGIDMIRASDGNDTVLGQKDVDFLFGGKGNDNIKGGLGDDSIEGGDGNDTLRGGSGTDILFGGEGQDLLVGGKYADAFVLTPNTGKDIIKDFQAGQDVFVLESRLRFGQELTFEQLSITQKNKNTIIAIAQTGEILALIKNISADLIGREDFVALSDVNSEALNRDPTLVQNALNYDLTLSHRHSNTVETSEEPTSANATGLVVSQAVEVMKVDIARNLFDVDGNGINIGVISDSFDRGQDVITTADDDILSGDIPGRENPYGNKIPVTILDDRADNSYFNLIDEGRAMIQLIHDVAPGANFLFHSAFDRAEDFAQGIDELIAAGADIIVDDIAYVNEPFFQDGVIAQAVDRAFAAGIPYFSAAGNSARNSYESAFRPVELNNQLDIAGLEDYHFHDFNPGAEVDILQNFTLEPGSFLDLSFQWDNPFASAGGKGATSDLDIFLLDENNQMVFSGAESNIGFDALELLSFVNDSDTVAEYKLLIGQNTAAGGESPNLIKYIDFAAGTIDAEFSTSSSTIFGHPNANGAEAVGAVNYQTPTEIEFFSSAGGTPILFDRHGDRLLEPEIRLKPEIVAPDGTNNTFFGFRDPENDGVPNFFGTSAAAPHAAGVAALLLEAKPDATPELIYQALEQTAIDLDDPFTPGEDIGFDFGSGFGLIQADLALEALIT